MKKALIQLAENEITSGNSRLTIKDAILTQQQQDAFEKAAGDYQIAGYFDIKLAQILYKNSAANLWVNDIAALKNPAKVSLQLGTDLEVEGNDLIVIHENLDGTYEVIPASFDSATKTVMFQTQGFSNYAVAYKKSETTTEDSTKETTTESTTEDPSKTTTKDTMDSYVGTDWYQKVLFYQYLVNYLGNYVEKKQDRVLEYELEYVLGGKRNDADNLKIVVSELLAMREPLNMASLTASSQRQSEAMALAVTLAGVSANPAVIEAVKYGILVAWAFAESVLDVRTLLSGGKITMIKSDADWTSNVHMIPELLSGWSVAKDCSQGLDYGQYAAILLLFHKGNTLAMRTMDVEEAYVQTQEGYENFQMDHVLCETELTATYEFQPVFLGFVSILENFSNGFRIQNHSGYSYFHGKEGM